MKIRILAAFAVLSVASCTAASPSREVMAEDLLGIAISPSEAFARRAELDGKSIAIVGYQRVDSIENGIWDDERAYEENRLSACVSPKVDASIRAGFNELFGKRVVVFGKFAMDGRTPGRIDMARCNPTNIVVERFSVVSQT